MTNMKGSLEKSYELLPLYRHLVKRLNAGTITYLVMNPKRKLKFVFISYGACIKGFSQSRKFVAMNGTWLKSNYKGVLLIPSAQDGNFQMYPIAWVVVDSENDASCQ